MTNQEIAEVGTLILSADLDKLRAISQDKSASVLKVWIASVAVKAISRGDAPALSIILDRIAGKPKEFVEHSGKVDSDVSARIAAVSDAELKARIIKIESDV